VSNEEESYGPGVKVPMEGNVEVSAILPSGKRSLEKRSLKEVGVKSSAATSEDASRRLSLHLLLKSKKFLYRLIHRYEQLHTEFPLEFIMICVILVL